MKTEVDYDEERTLLVLKMFHESNSSNGNFHSRYMT